MFDSSLRLRAAAALILSLMLAACGGGGGGGDSGPTLVQPPQQPAALAASTTDAAAAVQASVAGAGAVVREAAGLESSFLLFGNPLGAGASPSNLAARLVAVTRERPAASQEIACSALFGTANCTGSLTVSTNAPDSATVLAAGTYVSIRFNGLSGSDGFSTLSLDGTVRMDFLTTFDPDAMSFANARLQLTVTDFAGSYDGIAFGPESAVVLIEFDANGAGFVTVDGLRIGGLDQATITDADNYDFNGTTLRSAHWSDASRHVETRFADWNVVGGRSTAGSTLVIAAGSDNASITVTASSSSSVVYLVVFTINGISTVYAVTASYPAGGGTPTYIVVPG